MKRAVKTYTGKDKPAEISVVTKAKELTEYVLQVTEKTPKKYRFTFVTRLHNICFDIVSDIFYANSVYVAGANSESLLCERRRYQQRAKTNTRLLAYIADIAQKCGALTFHQFEVISRLTTDELKLLGAWIKSDRERFLKNRSLVNTEPGKMAECAAADLSTEQA